jgi:hypothetical protein
MKVHDFYKRNSLRVHEIEVGVKAPKATGWPDSQRPYGDVDTKLANRTTYNKYGWLLDDNHVVIDIDVHDPEKNGYESLAKLESAIGFKLDDACGAKVTSPSGGMHYYFTKPSDVSFGKVFTKEYPGIDFINGKGKQVIAADSRHDSYAGIYRINEDATLLEIPHKLIEHLQAIRAKKEPKPSASPSFFDWSERAGDEFNTTLKGLYKLMGEMQARGYTFTNRGDYYAWNRPGKTTNSDCSGHIGKKSNAGNYQLTAFTLSDDNFASGESMTIFYAYASLCHSGDGRVAAMALYDLGFAQNGNDADLTEFFKSIPKHTPEPPKPKINVEEVLKEIATKRPKRPALSDKELYPPGLLGDIVRYVVDTARFEHPEMALASTIAFAGMILGRRVMAIDDTRPNIYCLSIAESGVGKNHARKTIKRIMTACHIEIPSEGAASATGLVKSLVRNPSIVLQIDEAGMEFKAMRNPRSPMAEIGKQLSELFTSSSDMFTYRSYADVQNEVRVDQPHLSINATTTEKSLYKGGVSSDDIEQGLFGRFLLFRPKLMDPPERFDIEVQPIPDAIVAGICSWWEYTPWRIPAGSNMLPEHPEPMVVPFSESARKRYREYAMAIKERLDNEDELVRAVWRRSKEKTSRLALIHACMKSGKRDGIVIDKDSMDWGIAISNYSTRGMVYDMGEAMVETAYQDNCRKFLKSIPDSGIYWSALSKKNDSLPPKERKSIRDDLAELNLITVDPVETGGRPALFIKRVQ